MPTCTKKTNGTPLREMPFIFLVPVTGVARLRAERWSALTATGSHSLPTLRPRLIYSTKKQTAPLCERCRLFFGAGDRGRTGTVFPPTDFKSVASACSATPAIFLRLYYICLSSTCQREDKYYEVVIYVGK